MEIHPELASERAYIAGAYSRLDEMRVTLRENLREAYALERGGTPQSRAERDVVVRATLERLDRLDFGNLALCFGRIDRNADGVDSDERFYIGRIAVAAADMEPLVVDWRAPIAEPFYRATGRDAMGISMRRHFELHEGELVGIEDEYLGSGALPRDDGPELSGPGALFYAMDRARTGRMGDIVATIQAEQDEIIRAGLPGVTVVQGGPGTGKTAVALHRAAYLLYTHRARLERQGVLVVAPSGAFAKYIERVLPSLGETGVEISTVAGLIECNVGLRPASDGEERLKADRRMVDFIAKAVADRERPLIRDATFYLGSIQLLVTREMSRNAIRKARRRPATHNERRRVVEAILLRQLAKNYIDLAERFRDGRISMDQFEHGAELTEEAAFVEMIDIDEDAEEAIREVEQAIRVLIDFQRILQRIWSKLTPAQLLDDLYAHDALCHLAGQNILNPDEVDLLINSYAKGSFARADLALIDEAAVLLGSVKKRTADEMRKYGHIVVDEAQELSYMEARVLSRRSIASSMTLVGDLAQTTSPQGQRNWASIVEPLRGAFDQWAYRKLSVNYRTPTEIAELAYRLCDIGELDLEPSISIRSTGEYPVVVQVGECLVDAVCGAIDEDSRRSEAGLIAVIVPATEEGELLGARVLQALGDGNYPRERVEVLTIANAKGLEFDSVIVCGPTVLVNDAASAKAALFTALTRATKRVTVLYEGSEAAAVEAWGLLQKAPQRP